MTDVEPQEKQVEEKQVEELEPSRIAGGCVVLVLVGTAGGVVYAVPEVGYFVAGLLATGTVRKARGWLGGRRRDEDEQEDQEQAVDILEQLRALADGGQHVLLTQLQKAAGLPDTKAVRALLDEAGVPVRPGVRAGGKNGPGVHQKDIPPPLSPDDAPPAGRCLCSSDANTNTNNAPESGPEKGFRVEPIGQAGTVVHDPAEAHRHQQVRAH
jgi:hypothetical protein